MTEEIIKLRDEERKLPEVRCSDIARACELAIELGKKSTHVVGWYAHRYGNGTREEAATVRGPFCRWLSVHEGGGWTGERPYYVADPGDDAEFAAHAMNNVESISKAYLALKAAVALCEREKEIAVLATEMRGDYDAI